jgi:hypothetical protein
MSVRSADDRRGSLKEYLEGARKATAADRKKLRR